MTGDDIKTIRKACGVKQIEFADALGVTSRALGNWERDAKPAPSTIVRLVCCIRALGWYGYLDALDMWS